MDEKQIIKVSRQLQEVIGEETLDALARQTGYCEKKRLLTPFRMVLTMISGLGGRPIQFLADLQREFNALFGTDVAYKPFHNRLAKASFPDFMEAVAKEAWKQWSDQILSPEARELFSEFNHIVIQDGSSFAVKDSLMHVLPGRFYKVSPAAVELHVSLDLLTGTPMRVNLTPDTESERANQLEPASLAGSLCLKDRGYFDIKRLAEIDAAGGFFIVRATSSINPRIVSAHREDGTSLPHLHGKKLKTIRFDQRGAPALDLVVEWGPKANPIRHRLIMTWNPAHKQFQYLVTNLPANRYCAEIVREGYRLRWQIELLFKEWKSYANLHSFNTSKPAIAKGLIWASLIAAALNRYMAHSTQLAAQVEISTQRAAMSAVHFVTALMQAINTKCNQRVERAVENAMRLLAVNARRAHPKRDRRTGRTSSGLLPIGVPA